MPTLRKKTQTLELHANPDPQTEAPMISLYEQSREDRIKENLKRMQSLGIMDLSLKLKSPAPSKRTRKYSDHKSTQNTFPVLPSGPTRRSSRLQNGTPVSYSEVVLTKKNGPLEDEVFRLEQGSKQEVYTEEHEKLLGNTDRSWTFFVDGYGNDGKRIYDPVRGKTCHQCRQKTLGYRTHCNECNMVQGQFCGDCLYMRYGEHVLEAIENPNWICPVCRGICNCSLCRNGKGWLPTGAIYRKISKLGFKSVAHYLIQTQRAQANLEKELDTTNQASAKRSLSFPATEELSEEPPQVTGNLLEELKPQPEDKGDDKDFKCEKENKMECYLNLAISNPMSTRRSLAFLDTKSQSEIREAPGINLKVQDHLIVPQSEIREAPEINLEVHDHVIVSETQFKDKGYDGIRGEKEDSAFMDKEHPSNDVALESCRKPKRTGAVAIETNPESIAGRLRQRRRNGDGHNDEKLKGASDNVMQPVNNFLTEKELEKEKGMHFRNNIHGDGNITSECSPKIKKKTADLATEPCLDSIAGRLRQRHRKSEVPNNNDELAWRNEKTADVKAGC